MLIGIVQPSSNIATAEPLKQQRDELRVKLHLAKAEAKDEWARLEKQWEELRLKLEAARKEAGKTAESVGAAQPTAQYCRAKSRAIAGRARPTQARTMWGSGW